MRTITTVLVLACVVGLAQAGHTFNPAAQSTNTNQFFDYFTDSALNPQESLLTRLGSKPDKAWKQCMNACSAQFMQCTFNAQNSGDWYLCEVTMEQCESSC